MQCALLITCEHGGNRVPSRYRRLFAQHQAVLNTHRAYDPGALPLAQTLQKHLDAPLIASDVTRLLVELNRSAGHRHLFSEFSRSLSAAEKDQLLQQFYVPYREQVQQWIASRMDSQQVVVHLSVHTFVPQLNNVTRRADVGLLFDPSRPLEAPFCRSWQSMLQQERSDLVVRRNYPYLGRADGLTTYLRRRFAATKYAGIELEVNQRWTLGPETAWRKLQASLASSLAAVWNDPSCWLPD